MVNISDVSGYDGHHTSKIGEIWERHPADPEPVRSTKAAAVLALGVAAVVTGPLLGGVVPATVALALAPQAYGEMAAAEGYLTGATWLRRGEVLAWVGIALAATAFSTALVISILRFAMGTGGPDFPAVVD